MMSYNVTFIYYNILKSMFTSNVTLNKWLNENNQIKLNDKIKWESD